MSVMGYVVALSLACTYTAVCGLGLGLMFRRLLVPLRDYYSVILRVGLTIYGLALVLGKYAGMSTNTTLVVITATTAVVFNLNFWCFSEPNETKPETRIELHDQV